MKELLRIPSTINCKAFLGLQDFERVRQNRALAGICTGISELTGIRVIKIRILLIAMMAMDSTGGVFFFYLLFWLILPLREKQTFKWGIGQQEAIS
tara:strand:+ start:345 stop:632 length:288 start_codon:yes stop_codon:yes gene_type:complete